jgi:hypothetical protein
MMACNSRRACPSASLMKTSQSTCSVPSISSSTSSRGLTAPQFMLCQLRFAARVAPSRGKAVLSPKVELPLEPALFGEPVSRSERVSERGMVGGNAAEGKGEEAVAVVKEAASALAAFAIARARAATRASEAGVSCLSPA